MLAKQPNNPRVPHILVEKNRPDEDVLDEVYLRFAQSDPFLPIIHFVDHVTMGPEALVGLGLGGKVEKWVSRHRVRPYKPPTTGNFRASAWQTFLGRPDAHGDWLNYFEKDLENQPFQDVIARWVPRFAHEVGAFLFHGLIRTAHAVRALDHKDTRARRGELARGLALWAIGIKTDSRGPAQEPPRDLNVETELLGYAKVGAVALTQEANVPRVHLVTGPMAYHMISHHLEPAAHGTALASFANTHARAVREFETERPNALSNPIPSFDEKELDALVAQSDAHPIKLTEAALRAFERTEDELFLKAAGKAHSLHAFRSMVGIVKALASRRVN
jgi:hypothetical protein